MLCYVLDLHSFLSVMAGGVGANEWFEYDVADDSVEPVPSQSLVPHSVADLAPPGTTLLHR